MMRIIQSAWRLILIAVLVTAPLAVARPQQDTGYPDTEAGLQQFIENMLHASRNDRQRFEEMLKSLLIPNSEGWFHETFGENEGRRLAAAYALAEERLLKRLCETLPEISRVKNPQIKVKKHVDPSAMYQGLWRAVLTAAQGRTALYDVGYTKDRSPFALGDFFFIRGGFRVVDTGVMGALSTAPPMRVRIGGHVMLNKLTHQVRPNYPPEARDKGIQGTVRMSIIVGTDGAVKMLEVLSGDPLLAPAAADAVRKWRYQVTLLNGQPAEVVSVVDVIFSLSR